MYTVIANDSNDLLFVYVLNAIKLLIIPNEFLTRNGHNCRFLAFIFHSFCFNFSIPA